MCLCCSHAYHILKLHGGLLLVLLSSQQIMPCELLAAEAAHKHSYHFAKQHVPIFHGCEWVRRYFKSCRVLFHSLLYSAGAVAGTNISSL